MDIGGNIIEVMKCGEKWDCQSSSQISHHISGLKYGITVDKSTPHPTNDQRPATRTCGRAMFLACIRVYRFLLGSLTEILQPEILQPEMWHQLLEDIIHTVCSLVFNINMINETYIR